MIDKKNLHPEIHFRLRFRYFVDILKGFWKYDVISLSLSFAKNSIIKKMSNFASNRLHKSISIILSNYLVAEKTFECIDAKEKVTTNREYTPKYMENLV